LSLSPKHVLPADLELLGVFIIPRFVSRMIDTDQATTNIRSAKVVNR
jgi:hypothetical protein